MSKQIVRTRLTTVDNPFDIFTQFDDWYKYDHDFGYNCCELIDQFSYCSDSLSEYENEEEMERAVDEFIKNDVTGLYKKVQNIPVSM